MREAAVPSARETPYFLISYPHTEHNGDHGSERAPDYWVIKFYNDLCRNVEELVAAALKFPLAAG